MVLPRAARLLGMLEPALERVVYQDIPANLLALKHRVETRRAALKVAELEQQGGALPLTCYIVRFQSSAAEVGCSLCMLFWPPMPCTHTSDWVLARRHH